MIIIINRLFLNIILIFILIFCQNNISKSEWLKKDNYYELDNYVKEVLNYSILDNGDIWIVNKNAEVFFVDFETGKLEKKCQCEIPDSLLIRKVYFSTDGNTVSYGLYNKKDIIVQRTISTNEMNISLFFKENCQKLNYF